MPLLTGTSSHAFISLKGHAHPTALEVEEISRPGVDGHAYRKDAARGRPYEMIGLRDCDSLADAQNQFVAMRALQGQIVDTLDDYGVLTANIMLLGVERVDMMPIVTAVGGVSNQKKALLIVRFQMQVAQ